MGAVISERSVGGLRWMTVRGPRPEVFRALGAAAAAEIHAVLGGLPEAGALKAFAETDAGRRVVGDVLGATEQSHARELVELHDLAAGAGFDADAMVLANLRGDLGGDDGVGCSDLGWRGKRSYIAHNEDGAPALSGRFMLLTLEIDGELPVTTQWYPGFLPSNAFAATAAGVAWGINHVQVGRPAVAPGRHFVARALQHQPSYDATLDYLRTTPTAGGFTYTIGDVHSGRVATVEVAAGRFAVVEADPYLWHTNHLRYLSPQPGGAPSGGVRNLGQREESLARGEVLDALTPDEPDAEWFLEVLTEKVRRTAAGDDPLMTHCSAVINLTDRLITLQATGNPPVTVAWSALVPGQE